MTDVVAHRIDYDGQVQLESKKLHEILKEPQRPGASRLIFVTDEHHYATCHGCQQHLLDEWAWSEYFFRPTCLIANGYVQETLLDEGTTNERAFKHLRCLIKPITFDEVAYELAYTWHEMTYTTRQHRDGTFSMICFGVPPSFHSSFAKALNQIASEKKWKTPGERAAAVLIQELVELYDASIWKISKAVRKIEKDRFETQIDFHLMHELQRHTIHMTEVTEIAVDLLQQLSRARNSGQLQSHTATMSSDQMHKHYDFWCGLLKSFLRRSKSNESRLQNEISMAFNLVTQTDSRATIKISEAAMKDSAAMRTIAVVTLVFLPATFVATIFGMSFFNYQSTANEWSVAPQWWMFWATSVPLTILTIGAWIFGQVWAIKKGKDRIKRKTGLFTDSGTDGRKLVREGTADTRSWMERMRTNTGSQLSGRKGLGRQNTVELMSSTNGGMVKMPEPTWTAQRTRTTTGTSPA